MFTVEEKENAIQEIADKSPCLCFNLRKATRAVSQIYDNGFREIGLKVSQVSILTTCRMLGPITVTQLAHALVTDRTTITRNLKPLERDGYLIIRRGTDRRSREIVITDKGVEAMHKAWPIWRRLHERVFELLGKNHVDQLCQDLKNIPDGLKGF